jgi:hypothetical protein
MTITYSKRYITLSALPFIAGVLRLRFRSAQNDGYLFQTSYYVSALTSLAGILATSASTTITYSERYITLSALPFIAGILRLRLRLRAE